MGSFTSLEGFILLGKELPCQSNTFFCLYLRRCKHPYCWRDPLATAGMIVCSSSLEEHGCVLKDLFLLSHSEVLNVGGEGFL